VRKLCENTLCDDPEGHGKRWAVMNLLKGVAAGKTRQQFQEAFQVLDDAFGADAWRPQQCGGKWPRFSLPSSS
jgi:hypothetical protein